MRENKMQATDAVYHPAGLDEFADQVRTFQGSYRISSLTLLTDLSVNQASMDLPRATLDPIVLEPRALARP